MKILNLYSGLGGNRYLWGDDHEITSVENNKLVASIYKKRFPQDKLIIGDAHHYLEQNYQHFDFIWSSPPCQTHSRTNTGALQYHGNVRYLDWKLWQEIIFLQFHANVPYVVENVVPYYKPFIYPAYKHSRHYFWAENTSCVRFYDLPETGGDIVHQTGRQICKWLGMPYDGDFSLETHNKVQAYRNCVHPLIGKSFLDAVTGQFDIKLVSQTQFAFT